MKRYGEYIWNNIRQERTSPHVAVWENFMETHVSDNCCIHHVDQDPLNNDILNLVCVTRPEHQRWHSTHRSLVTRCKISKSNSISQKGKHHSEETRKKISESLKGKPGNFKGKKHSEERKKHISESKKGKPWSEARRLAHERKHA